MHNQKKDIFFVLNNLHVGGAEKALISLLQTIDYAHYTVDLLLFKQEGLFLNQLPKEVHLLPEPINYKYFDMSIKTAILENLKKGNFKVIYYRILAGFLFKSEKNKALAEQKLWSYLGKTLSPLPKKYYAAVGYLEKTPNYYCIDKVTAKTKIGFIHNDYEMLKMDATIDYEYMKKFDKVFTVSETCKAILIKNFPDFTSKFDVMFNIVSGKTIHALANEKINFDNQHKTIVTVGRLNKQKGYELAIEACSLLKKQGISLKWYVLGEGEERETLEKLIFEFDVEDSFILKGIIENPYPYVKAADVYVQTSRFEGKSIAIDEAKILNKPIVVTAFDTVYDQITHLQNGLIVPLEPIAIANVIQKLLEDEVLSQVLVTNLENERKGNEEEINKILAVIG